VSQSLRADADATLNSVKRARSMVDWFLTEHPNSRVAHHAASLTHLQNAIALMLVEIREREEREAAREARRAENARDRARRSAEPHELKAAERMGFGDDVALWRQYVDEREAATDRGSFPSPEEWRRKEYRGRRHHHREGAAE
jgi:hypothetical protein